MQSSSFGGSSRQSSWSRTLVMPLCALLCGIAQGEFHPANAQPKGDIRIVRRTPPGLAPYCATDSLYVCLRQVGVKDMSLRHLEDITPITQDGTSISDVLATSEAVGMRAQAVKTSIANLLDMGTPSVLYVNQSHYIALLSGSDDRLRVYDNAVGLFECNAGAFRQHYRWDGIAVVIGSPQSIAARVFGSAWTTIGCLCLLLPQCIAAFKVLQSVLHGSRKEEDNRLLT
jgi:hypothetical protein